MNPDPLEPESSIADAIDASEEILGPLDGLVGKNCCRPRRSVHARGSGSIGLVEEG
jgi:hypothetical protein